MKVRIIIAAISILFFSCKNDIEVIKNLTEHASMPDLYGEQVEILQCDSGYVKVKMTAPRLIRYTETKEPYYEFPKGLHVYSYNSKKELVSEIEAEYGKYFETPKLWLGRINVIARNIKKGEELKTEELYWDQAKGILYTDKFVSITNASGTFYGERGFEADQNMDHWKLIGSKGSLNVKDKEKDKESK